MTHRILLFTTLTAAAIAQTAFAQDTSGLFNRPPAGIDQALRARINLFFQYHVTGDRRAEELVAEDTKDYFYLNNKPRYLSFDVRNIEYSNGYTEAKAMVVVKMAVMMPGISDVMEIPTPSYWHLIDGNWYWHLTKAQQNMGPMGEMKPGPPSAASVAAKISAIPTNPSQVYAQVKVDKSEVSLKPGTQEQIAISNDMAGPIDLAIEGKLAGIDASFDRSQIKPGEKATLTLNASEGAKAGQLTVVVQQTGQPIPIQVVLK